MQDFPLGIRCGTVVHGNADTANYIKQMLPYGFESFQLTFGHKKFDHSLDLQKLGESIQAVLADSNAVVSSIGVYGNPVMTDTVDGDEVARGFDALIANAHHFGCDLVTGFSGGLDGSNVKDSCAAVVEKWTPKIEAAKAAGVRLAWENCPMGSTANRINCNTTWSPVAWEILEESLQNYDNWGYEWEPCHHMIMGMDVLAHLRQWAPRILHIQGKCATIAHDVIAKYGHNSGVQTAWHRHPGFGDLNWNDVFTILRQHQWTGTVDIEGWHDPVYRGDLETTGQVTSLKYLQRCRGGRDFIPNPT